MDTDLITNISYKISGLKKVQALTADNDALAAGIEKQSIANRSAARTTSAVNAVLKKKGGIYGKVRTAQVSAISQMNREKAFADKLGVSYNGLHMGLRRAGMQLEDNGDLSTDTGQKIKNQTAAQQKLVASTKRFRMELLSVMFFGMAVARIFGALTKGSLEASGATSVWGVITMMVGLPAAMKMTEWLLKLYAAYDILPDGMKEFISWTLFSGQALGSLLQGFGMFGLGIIGMKTAFPWLTAGLKGVGTAFTWVGAKLALIPSVFAYVGGALVVLWGLFRGIGGWIQGNWWKMVSGTVIAVGGIIALVMGGWIPLAIAAAIGGIMLLADKFSWLKKSVMSILSPITYLVSIMMNLGDSFKTGNWKGFWGRVNALGSLNTWWDSNSTAMASGGIVTSPTRALIGESGPEAVIPLTGPNAGAGLGGLVYSPTINVNASVSNEMDVRSIARILNDMLYTELRRLGVR